MRPKTAVENIYLVPSPVTGMCGESRHVSDGEKVAVSNFEDLLAEISPAFVRATADQISPLIDNWLRRIVLALDVDRASVGQLNHVDGFLYVTHLWAREGITPILEAVNANEMLPAMADERLPGHRRITLAGDRGYDTRDFVAACRALKVTPHVARNDVRPRGSALEARTVRHPGYAISQRIRKRVEEAFGWMKTVGVLRQPAAGALASRCMPT